MVIEDSLTFGDSEIEILKSLTFLISITSLLKSLDFRKFFLKAFEGDYLSEISVRIEVFG